MTPHLPSLLDVQGNGVWPPFDLHLYRKWPQFDLVWVKMVTWWHWNVQSSQTTLECWILKVLESIYDFGGHGGQMEVKTRSDQYGDGIFEKYGQKYSCVQKRPPIGWKLWPRTPPLPLKCPSGTPPLSAFVSYFHFAKADCLIFPSTWQLPAFFW